ncbi:SLC26A/SulP transporter domain,STAS domain [Cinara cedri]|uniref:SLC26A/SulP transporter domain,STAS domain n=1 Tax=Cinara cedri TaxID=506608 RepID=A0A5E4NLC2_9HEMI|nr:SLC26A/SulP transporter domain,STAS domain [Cinara cedri]
MSDSANRITKISIDAADNVSIKNNEMCNTGSSDLIITDETNDNAKNHSKPYLKNVDDNGQSSSITCKYLAQRLPILQWLPVYTSEDFVGDLLAGITVGLTLIPQSMSFAILAGLPPQQGLYGSIIGSILYTFLGTCREISMGPTAIVSLMTYNTLRGLGPVHATTLCFLSGFVQLAIGLVGLGFLIDFISGPVNSGFTSAVAVLIVLSQVKDLIGVKCSGTTMLDMVVSISKDITNYRLGDTCLGIVCIVVILLLRVIGTCRIGPADENLRSKFHVIANRSMWVIGTFRNTIVLIISSYASYLYINSTGRDPTTFNNQLPFKVVGKIPSGLPNFNFPKFRITDDEGRVDIGFFEIVSELGFGIIVLPLIALVENISICKTFANGKPIDATQEFLAIGLCNIGNSFFHAYPGTGSFSRSAVCSASGVRTTLEGLYAGILVIISLMFCTPYMSYIPKTTLAAIIIGAVIFMVEVRMVKPIYRSKKSDLVSGLGTFFACLLLPIEKGILIGIGLSLMSIIYHSARPKLSIKINTTPSGRNNYLMITPDRCILFPSVEHVRNIIIQNSFKHNLPVVIDCSHIYGADFTAAKLIEILNNDFARKGRLLFFYNLKPSLVKVFEGALPKNFNIRIFNDARDIDQPL